jgi:predicted Abi (CAAX) family protease
LWIAIRQLRQQGATTQMSPVEREQLRKLGLAFDQLLKPFGQVRGDWAQNAKRSLAAGTGQFETSQSLKDALLSWRSILPRGAHDLFASEFLRVGLPLAVLRSNQIPGTNPRLAPVAPTALFGQLPWLSTLLGRLGDSLFPVGESPNPIWSLPLAIGIASLALRRGGKRLLLIIPAVAEELVFRVLLLPSPVEAIAFPALLPWLALSVGGFVAWHGLILAIRRGAPPLPVAQPRVLVRMSLLGGLCAVAYVLSGSLWPPVLIHWLALVMGNNRAAGLE